MQRQTGRYERTHFGGKEVAAFVPEPLPPQNPRLALDGALRKRLHRAEDALGFARSQIADPHGLPLSLRLLNETHKYLMRGVRGSTKQPGEIRWSQNWIGGSRPGNAMYVPPPPSLLPDLLSSLEKYIHHDDGLPPLVRAGLLHVQFETIHPYLDGDGRIGRLLVTLLLEHWKLLTKPLLYLSLFLKRHRTEYYRHLNARWRRFRVSL